MDKNVLPNHRFFLSDFNLSVSKMLVLIKTLVSMSKIWFHVSGPKYLLIKQPFQNALRSFNTERNQTALVYIL